MLCFSCNKPIPESTNPPYCANCDGGTGPEPLTQHTPDAYDWSKTESRRHNGFGVDVIGTPPNLNAVFETLNEARTVRAQRDTMLEVCKEVHRMFEDMTRLGYFDDMCGDFHPDDINQTIDLVSAAIAAATGEAEGVIQ